MAFEGYRQLKLITETENFSIFAASGSEENSDGSNSVLIRQFKTTPHGAHGSTNAQRELQLFNRLDWPNLAKAKHLINSKDLVALVFTLPDCESLIPITQLEKNDVALALDISVQLTYLLEHLHSKQIVLNRIDLDSVFLLQPSKQLLVTSLSAATPPQSRHVSIQANSQIEASFIVAPEVSLKTNRSIDHRADFFMVGTILEENIKQIPDPEMPLIIKELINRLTATYPEDRYQSAFTLLNDLEICRSSFEIDDAEIKLPDLGLDDIPEHLSLIETLLDREQHISETKKYLSKVQRGDQHTIVFWGDNGSGKTSLLREIRSELETSTTHVLIGLHNPINKNRPFTVLTSALSDFASHLRNHPKLIAIRTEINIKVGFELSLIELVSPDLFRLLKLQSNTYNDHTSNGSNQKLAAIISIICGVLHDIGENIVLCIDNIQWVDQASLALFEALSTQSRSPAYLLIATFNTSNANKDANEIENLLASFPRKDQLHLVSCQNLDISSTHELITKSLFRPYEETRQLAETVLAKTSGNPLAIHEFLLSLEKSGLLRFDALHREWNWDLDTIKLQPPATRVSIELGASAKYLAPNLEKVLSVIACKGDHASLEMISYVVKQPPNDTTVHIAELSALGYIVPSTNLNHEDTEPYYGLCHEMLQESIYQRLAKPELTEIHNLIAQYYLDMDADKANEYIYEIVGQLNANTSQLQDIDFRTLCHLNRRAADRANQTAAFGAALNYLEHALTFSKKNSEQSLQLILDVAQAAFQAQEQTKFENLLNEAKLVSTSVYENALIDQSYFNSLYAQNKLIEAIALGDKVLASLGYSVKPINKSLRIIEIHFDIIPQLKRMVEYDSPISSLLQEKKMDRETALAVDILSGMRQAKFLIGSVDTLDFMTASIRLCLEHQLTGELLATLPLFAGYLDSYKHKKNLAFALSSLAQKSLKLASPKHQSEITTLNGTLSFARSLQPEACVKILDESAQLGFESNNIPMSQFAATQACTSSFLFSHDLTNVFEKFEQLNLQSQAINHHALSVIPLMYQQAIANLNTINNAPWLLEGNIFSENQFIQFQPEKHSQYCLFNLYFIKLILATIFPHPQNALNFAKEARLSLGPLRASVTMPYFLFYEALACLRGIGSDISIEQLFLKNTLRKNLAELKVLGDKQPERYQYAFHLLSAEIAKKRKNTTKAVSHYDKAISLSYKQLREHALACELAGRFYYSISNNELATFFLSKAKKSLIRLGAEAKVKLLHSEITEISGQDQSSEFDIKTIAKTNQTNSNLNLETVINASQLLSGEVDLDKLLQRFLSVALKNANATHGSLLLMNDERLYIEISSTFERTMTSHNLDHESLEKSRQVPKSIINYVARTHEDLILNDPANNDIFTEDEYIHRHRPGSILCTPIHSQSKLSGILYLENRSVRGIYSHDKLSILKLLSSQASIAIENAKLYRQLSQSRNKYLSLYQNAVEGIFEFTAQGDLVTINPAASELTGFLPTEEGQSMQRINLKKVFVQEIDMRRFLKKLLKNNRISNFETIIRHRNGRERSVILSAKVIKSRLGGIDHIEASVIDISDRKKRESADQARKIAETAAETKSQFLASMSHEIRTPMNAIIGYTDLALRTQLTHTQADYLDTIKSSSNQLLRVVNDILDISKVESGRMELQLSEIKISHFIEDLYDLFSYDAKLKGLDLKLPTLDDYQDITFHGDQTRISQVLINLLDNAIKFTNSGGIRVEVGSQKLSKDVVQLNFSVTDTGIGIVPENLDTIFESFSHTGPLSTETGTGLGLTICKRLVEMMSGKIHVSSQPDKGSTFYFSINVQPCQVNLLTERDSPKTKTENVDFNNHLLLVEDNPINQDLAYEILSSAGYQVSIANHGQEALTLLSSNRFASILMDLRMPVMNGIEAVKIMRSEEQYQAKKLPIYALSAGVLQSEIDEALNAGFDRYITKPIDFESLLLLLADGPSAVDIKPPLEEKTEPEIHFGTIGGVEFDKGLKAHDFDDQLMLKLSQEFVRIYADAATTLGAHLATHDLEQAERLVHNIAGVSGTFGAFDLMESARVVEHKLVKKLDVPTGDVEQFSDALSNCVSAISQLNEQQSVQT